MPAKKPTAAKKSTRKKKTTTSRTRKKKLPEGMNMEDMTRVRAFEIWEKRGGGGDEVANWQQAEAEIAKEYKA